MVGLMGAVVQHVARHEDYRNEWVGFLEPMAERESVHLPGHPHVAGDKVGGMAARNEHHGFRAVGCLENDEPLVPSHFREREPDQRRVI